MDLLSRASTYLQTENTEYDSTPNSVGINFSHSSDDVDYVISGQFPKEQEKDKIQFPKERVPVDRSSKMHSLITDVFETIHENVSIIGDAEISSIHIRSTSDMKNAPGDWSFYASENADARIFIGVLKEYVPADVKEELLDLFVTDVQKFDAELTTDNIQNSEFLFSDMQECTLQTVCGNIMTPRPHNHFEEVSSLQEYIDAIADTKEEKMALCEQEKYKVYHRFADAGSTPDDAVREVGERIMWDFITESLTTNWEYIVEAEGIYIGDFEADVFPEAMKYYVNIPIVGNEIGVTKQ